uniref:Secreted protein n=1 Tax=Trichogramma kaykai TaxID=54128 RepID=A0ABD2WJY3_9HYME
MPTHSASSSSSLAAIFCFSIVYKARLHTLSNCVYTRFIHKHTVTGKISRAANLASAWGVRFEARGGGVAALGSAACTRLQDVDARTAVILESSTCHKR